MTDSTEVADLLAQVKAGDQQAASDLFHRYESQLVRLARSQLDLELQRKVDPEDVVQSVFGSFFRRHRADEINVQSWESLWSLLAVITAHKCGNQIRYYRAAKRDARMEQSPVRYSDDAAVHWEAISRGPSPSAPALLTEALQELLRPLEERERQMIVLMLQGYSVEEISNQVERSERTVRRVQQRIRTHLENRCEGSK